MSGDRYVLLGLASPRAAWFENVARWANSTAIAAEFIKCVSAEEVRVRLSSGRPHSALLIDATMPAFDRDLVDAGVATGTPVIAVRSGAGPMFSGPELGLALVLPGDFGRDDLVDALDACCEMVGRGAELPGDHDADWARPVWLSQMFSVCGSGGTGASTLSIALAQGLAADARHGGRVLLADLALRADQAMLHDAPDVGPGIQELIEAHRLGQPGSDEIHRITFEVPARNYRLLLGLRQPEAWAALRPRAIDSAIVGLRQSFHAVVADVTGEVEGEAECGSVDIEERNHLSRSAVLHSAVVIAVGVPGLKGVHSLARLVRALSRAGVPTARIVTVFNRSPRSPHNRAESTRALSGLLAASGISLSNPIPIPERKIDDDLRDGKPLAVAVVDPLTRAVMAAAERQADDAPPRVSPIRIEPGSLGSWADVGGGTS